MSDVLLTVTEYLDGVAVQGDGVVTITVTEGSGGGGGGAVDSVNGEVGVVVLDATDVGADPAGTASTAVSTHVADTTDAHALAGITGLQAALDAKAATTVTDALDTRLDTLEGVDNATQAELDAHAADTTSVHGIADTSVLATDAEVATAVSDHAAAADPHTGYLKESSAAAVATSGSASDLTSGTLNAARVDTTSEAERIRDVIAAALVAGSNVTITPNDGSDTITIAATGGGGAGVTADAKRRGSTNLTFNNTTWATLDTNLDITLAAVAGDWIWVEPNGMWNNNGAVSGFMDVVTVVSGSPVNSITKRAAPDGTEIGSYSWFGDASVYSKISGGIAYQVQSGDISGGNVLLRIRVKCSGATNKTILCTAIDPFHFSAMNLG